jgi:glycerate kinase
VISAVAAGAVARRIPVLVLAGQVALPEAVLRAAGIAAARSIADYAGSVRLAIDDAANQLAGLASETAAARVWGDRTRE